MAETTTSNTLKPEEMREYIKSAVNKLGPKFSKEEKKEHGRLLVKIFEQGMSPKEAMNISDEEIAQLYSFAFHKFSTKKYEEARELFKMLLSLEPFNKYFSTALGVCHHKLKDFEYALHCYMLGFLLDPNNPVNLFYAYDCYLNLKDEVPAAIMLSNVIARAGDQPAYAQIKKHAEMLLEPLQQKIIQNQIASGKISPDKEQVL